MTFKKYCIILTLFIGFASTPQPTYTMQSRRTVWSGICEAVKKNPWAALALGIVTGALIVDEVRKNFCYDYTNFDAWNTACQTLPLHYCYGAAPRPQLIDRREFRKAHAAALDTVASYAVNPDYWANGGVPITLDADTANQVTYAQKIELPVGSTVGIHGGFNSDVHSLVNYLHCLAQQGFTDKKDPFNITDPTFYLVIMGPHIGSYKTGGRYDTETVYTLLRLIAQNPGRIFLLHEEKTENGIDLQGLKGFNHMETTFPRTIYLGKQGETQSDVVAISTTPQKDIFALTGLLKTPAKKLPTSPAHTMLQSYVATSTTALEQHDVVRAFGRVEQAGCNLDAVITAPWDDQVAESAVKNSGLRTCWSNIPHQHGKRFNPRTLLALLGAPFNKQGLKHRYQFDPSLLLHLTKDGWTCEHQVTHLHAHMLAATPQGQIINDETNKALQRSLS